MKCPICDRAMNISSDRRYLRWDCPVCGWYLRITSLAAMDFYWLNNRSIECDISFSSANVYDMDYHTPIIRDERKFVSGDIGDFITREFEEGKQYIVQINIVEVKR